MSPMPTHPRFPEVASDSGHYESFYLKAARPGGGLGFWLRHTVHKRPDAAPTASVWLTLFDAESTTPLATKVTVGDDGLSVPEGAYIAVGGSRLEPGHAVGSVATASLEASWDLRFTGSEEAFRHLPRAWMYRAPIPRTKLLSPHPDSRYSGRLEVGGRTIDVGGWPGMVGHNWGAEHAERWIWMHGGEFDSEPDAWFDAALGRIRIGRWTVPWIGNGVIAIDGHRHRVGGIERVRSTEVRETPTRCEFTLPGSGARVRGTVSAPKERFVGWVYADPDGSEHNIVNCSIADMELTVEVDGSEPRTLRCSAGAAYELGMRETDHGIPIQPFTDG